MKLKNNKHLIYIFTFALAILISIFLANHFFWKGTSMEMSNYDCSTTFDSKINTIGFATKMNIFLHIKEDSTAHLDIVGNVAYKKDNYNAARAYDFNYRKQNGDIYHLTNIKMSKRSADNTADNIMNSLFFSYDSNAGRYIKIRKINNAYIISNFYSPLFICVAN
jgi:hypothetical protein